MKLGFGTALPCFILSIIACWLLAISSPTVRHLLCFKWLDISDWKSIKYSGCLCFTYDGDVAWFYVIQNINLTSCIRNGWK